MSSAIETWIKLGDRTTYLGASEVPIVMGSLYLPQFGVTRWHLWASKVGHPDYQPRDGGLEAALGSALERGLIEFVKQKWTVYTDSSLTELHIADTPIIAHLDAVGQEGDELFPIECKTSGLFGNKAVGWSPDDLPWHVYHQVQTQIAALGAKRAIVVALLGGFGAVYHEYEVYRDDAVIEEILAKTREFWKHVENNTPPEEQPFDVSQAVKVERRGAIELPEDLLPVLQTYQQAKDAISQYEEQVDQARAEILKALGTAERGHVRGWTVVAKRVTQHRVDTKRLQVEFPQTYQKCLEVSEYLRLQVKPPREEKQ